MGRKDIIKIEGSLDLLDLDALGYIDHKITVNIIKDLSLIHICPAFAVCPVFPAYTPSYGRAPLIS